MPAPDPAADSRIPILAWTTLWLTVAVVIGGALVRATDSGAGCGESWPICGGQIIPDIGNYHTLVEVSHRLMTGLLGIVLLTLFVLVRKHFDKSHRLRRAVFAAGMLLIIESLLGASLVLFGWVEYDASIARLIVVPIHLVNTFLLVGAMTLAAFFAGGGRGFRVELSKNLDKAIVACLSIVLVIGATGALNALADTLIKSDTLRPFAGDEVQLTETVLRQIRTIHPFVAIIGGLALYMLVRFLAAGAERRVRLLALGVQGVIWTQLIVGMLNIALNVPLEIQLIHLFVADVLWITVVLIAFNLLSSRAAQKVGDETMAEAT